MAPKSSRSTAVHDESKADPSGAKDKAGSARNHAAKEKSGHAGHAGNGKQRQATTLHAQARELAQLTINGGPGLAKDQSSSVNRVGSQGIQWDSLGRRELHACCREFGIKSPTSFISERNRYILSQEGVGKYSPSMQRRRGQTRQAKEKLIASICRYLDTRNTPENEAVATLIHRLRLENEERTRRRSLRRPL